MARIPGTPSGNRYNPSELRSRKFTCRCYPGQEVTISRGLPNRCEPTRVTVVNEYDSVIVFKLEFDKEDWNGKTETVSWNYSISKASLMCGDALVKDYAGRMIRPSEVEGESLRKRQSKRGNGTHMTQVDDIDSLI